MEVLDSNNLAAITLRMLDNGISVYGADGAGGGGAKDFGTPAAADISFQTY
jgi:hypothetical protein